MPERGGERRGLNLLVVEESVLLRRQLADMLAAWPEVAQVVTAATANIALARLAQNRVDAVLVDLAGEQGEGLKVLPGIREREPDLPILGLGEMDAASARLAVKALQLGVLEVVARPLEKSDAAARHQFRGALGGLLMGLKLKQVTSRARRLLALAPDLSSGRPESRPEPTIRPSAVAPSDLQVVAIGISTGGPNALRKLIPGLPADLGVPVLIVQHMPPNFTRALAESLDRESALSVREAREGDVPLPGEVYIAPGGRHMVARVDRLGLGERTSLGLCDDPPVNSCRPSVDVLFRSLASAYNGRVLMVIMTGMGNDGMAGVAETKRLGGYCLTQSEDSCVVYGMPRAVDEAGLSDEKAPLEEMARRIQDLLRPDGENGGAS